ENIAETLREVRLALLEADVALPVVKTFIESVKTSALGQEVVGSLTPGQAFIGVIHRELVAVMGAGRGGLNLRVQPPLVVLLAGLSLTKADGDARGGAALSVQHITGQPILFVGTGEKTEALEPFDAERMAQRILGMGDVVALVETVQKNVDVQEAEKLAKKFAK